MVKEHADSKAKAHEKSGDWIEDKPEEVKHIVIELANSGLTESEIGMSLRDQYGIPSIKKLTGKTVGKILEEKGITSDFPRDLLNLIKKSVKLQRHMEANKKDMSSKRGYQLTVSKIRKLTKYYSEKSKIPKGWRYTQEEAALLVK